MQERFIRYTRALFDNKVQSLELIFTVRAGSCSLKKSMHKEDYINLVMDLFNKCGHQRILWELIFPFFVSTFSLLFMTIHTFFFSHNKFVAKFVLKNCLSFINKIESYRIQLNYKKKMFHLTISIFKLLFVELLNTVRYIQKVLEIFVHFSKCHQFNKLQI